MPEATAISTDYDRDGDVLYVTCRDEAADHAEQDDFGMLWRYDARGEVVGVTIMDAGVVWRDHKSVVEGAVARRLRIPPGEAGALFDRAFGDGGA